MPDYGNIEKELQQILNLKRRPVDVSRFYTICSLSPASAAAITIAQLWQPDCLRLNRMFWSKLQRKVIAICTGTKAIQVEPKIAGRKVINIAESPQWGSKRACKMPRSVA